MMIQSSPTFDPLDIPVCHNTDKVLLLADRYTRASNAMAEWATKAKECIEMTEGKQWSEEAIAKLAAEDRPSFAFNKIRPLVRLVLGYHRNNRMDLKVMPGWDGSGTMAVAEALSKVCKQLSEINHEPYVDTEVVMDGIITGRGFYDVRLNFEDNELGEMKLSASDPFSTLLDPDADQYDLNSGAYVMDDRWVNIDEIESVYGVRAAMLLRPLVGARSGFSGVPSSILERQAIATPWRTFGGQKDSEFSAFDSYYSNAYDPARKNIRLVECQHYVRVRERVFIDLETGVKSAVPDEWSEAQLQKIMAYSEEKYAMKGRANPLRLAIRPGRRARWTTMVGDIIVHDDWSKYKTFTKVGFFPWFRRGQTQGMVEDLLDSQREINKRRSAQIDIVTRTAHSGYMYEEGALSPEEEEKIENYGAMPGINIKHRAGKPAPVRIQPATPPMAFERLELRANDDMKEISSINDSSLGLVDRVQSGRAIEARQRQGVIGIQVYMDNLSRSKERLGLKKLEMIQCFYTEERLYRILGDDGQPQDIILNQQTAQGIANDVTSGRYSLVVDETPMSKSFLSGQFDEMLELVKAGVLPVQVPMVQDVIIDMSSLPHKERLKQGLQAMQQAAQAQEAAAMGLPPQGAPQEPGSLVAANGQVVPPGG